LSTIKVLAGTSKLCTALVLARLRLRFEFLFSKETKVGKGNKELKAEILENRKRIDKFGMELASLSDHLFSELKQV